jgi:hypothetical protein
VRILAVFLVLLLAVPGAPAVAGATSVQVKSKPGFEFGAYESFAWGKGTPAIHAEIEARIVAAVEAELAARGIEKADAGQAQLVVSTYAFAELEMDVVGRSYWGEVWGVMTTQVSEYKKGVLWIKLADPRGEAVWQAIAGKAVAGKPEKLLPKIDEIVAKMFAKSPSP